MSRFLLKSSFLFANFLIRPFFPSPSSTNTVRTSPYSTSTVLFDAAGSDSGTPTSKPTRRVRSTTRPTVFQCHPSQSLSVADAVVAPEAKKFRTFVKVNDDRRSSKSTVQPGDLGATLRISYGGVPNSFTITPAEIGKKFSDLVIPEQRKMAVAGGLVRRGTLFTSLTVSESYDGTSIGTLKVEASGSCVGSRVTANVGLITPDETSVGTVVVTSSETLETYNIPKIIVVESREASTPKALPGGTLKVD